MVIAATIVATGVSAFAMASSPYICSFQSRKLTPTAARPEGRDGSRCPTLPISAFAAGARRGPFNLAPMIRRRHRQQRWSQWLAGSQGNHLVGVHSLGRNRPRQDGRRRFIAAAGTQAKGGHQQTFGDNLGLLVVLQLETASQIIEDGDIS